MSAYPEATGFDVVTHGTILGPDDFAAPTRAARLTQWLVRGRPRPHRQLPCGPRGPRTDLQDAPRTPAQTASPPGAKAAARRFPARLAACATAADLVPWLRDHPLPSARSGWSRPRRCRRDARRARRLGALRIGWSAGIGSSGNTSMAARKRPACSKSVNASKSTTWARLMSTNTASRRMSSSFVRSICRPVLNRWNREHEDYSRGRQKFFKPNRFGALVFQELVGTPRIVGDQATAERRDQRL